MNNPYMIKMRQFITRILITLFLCGAIGCSEEEDDSGLRTNVSEILLSGSTATFQFVLTAESPWSTTSDAHWLTLSPASGKPGKNVITIKPKENYGPLRRAYLQINTTTGSRKIKIEQAQTNINFLSPEKFEQLSNYRTDIQVLVQRNGLFSAYVEKGSDWITISHVDTLSPKFYIISISTNREGLSREGVVIFKDLISEQTVSFPIVQGPDPDCPVIIPDDEFRQYCINNYDYDGDGKISYPEIKYVTSMSLQDTHIRSLSGIQYFLRLQELEIRSNPDLTDVDLSKNWQLKKLICDNSPFTRLNLPQASNLTSLILKSAALPVLDLSTSTDLTEFEYLEYCGPEKRVQLDFSRNTALKKLSLSYLKLQTLNISALPELTALSCSHNELTELDITRNVHLTDLNCRANRLSQLELAINSGLKTINCSENKFSRLDISKNKKLTLVDASDTPLNKIYVWAGFNPHTMFWSVPQNTEVITLPD